MRPLLVLVLGLAGCAFSDGGFVTTLLPDALSARLALPAERLSAGGWLGTRAGYEVLLDGLAVEASDLVLLGADGAQVVTLALPGDAARVPVALRVPGPMAGVPFAACRPRCELEQAEVAELRLYLLGLQLSGQVRGPGLGAPAEALAIDVPLVPRPHAPASDGVPVRRALRLGLDRSTAERLRAVALLELPAGFLDGVDFAALPQKDGRRCLRAAGAGCDAGTRAAPILADLAAARVSLDLLSD